jgi:hypothetical protein
MQSSAVPLMLLVLATCAAPFAHAADEPTETVSIAIPAQEPPSRMLIETFLDQGANLPQDESEHLHLTWWSWSDETGSNWPDDDAKARRGQLGMDGNSTTVFNEQDQEATAKTLLLTEPVLTLEGSIQLMLDEQGGIAIHLPVKLTPLTNLGNDTVLSIFITEDRSVDHHGRVAHNLVRDMMPQVGFSVQANNTTDTTWVVPSTHLEAAGIEFDEQPHGWHITLAFFGGLGDENESRLLGLYSTPIPTTWDASTAGDFFLPSFLLILCLVVASGAVMGSFKREKGMPRIDAQWISSEPAVLQFRIQAGTQPLALNGCSVAEPWAVRGGFKRVKITAGNHHEFTLRLKQSEADDCHVSLNVEVEELGSWTQYLRLPSAHEALRSVQDKPKQAMDGGEA